MLGVTLGRLPALIGLPALRRRWLPTLLSPAGTLALGGTRSLARRSHLAHGRGVRRRRRTRGVRHPRLVRRGGGPRRLVGVRGAVRLGRPLGRGGSRAWCG